MYCGTALLQLQRVSQNFISIEHGTTGRRAQTTLIRGKGITIDYTLETRLEKQNIRTQIISQSVGREAISCKGMVRKAKREVPTRNLGVLEGSKL